MADKQEKIVKKEITNAIVGIPSGVQIEITKDRISTKGPQGTNARRINDALLKVVKEGSKVTIAPLQTKGLEKKSQMAVNSFAKVLNNDIAGVQKHFERNLQIIFAHFPMTMEAKGDTVIIKNLIGERGPRTAKIAGATKVEIKGQNIRVYGPSLEDVTQTTANMRKACKIRKKDERIFQDGVYFPIEQ